MNKKMKMVLAIVAAMAVATGCRCVSEGGRESAAPFSDACAELPGTPYGAEPVEAELLDESGAFALFSGETAEDAAFNKDNLDESRNSLFLRRRRADGTCDWRLLLTTGSDWHGGDGMDKWCSTHADMLKRDFVVREARFALDGRHLWLVCDTSPTFDVVCSYDLRKNVFRVLIDGFSVDEQPDGTILVKDKKTYLFDENGEPLGARWYDAWINPDGEVVRKGRLKTAEEVEGE